MRVAIIGTYPPTRCGIATFTADVEGALVGHGLTVLVVPVHPEKPPVNDCVNNVDNVDMASSPLLLRDDPSSYVATAQWLNSHDIDVVLIQHEFGIYGGESGDSLLHLTEVLTVPYVITLHTVLPHFSRHQGRVLESLCGSAAAVTVFTSTARRLLLEQELVSSRHIRVVAHGAPIELYRSIDPQAARHGFGLPTTGPVLSTFGLLSSGKGIELSLKAVGRLVEKWPTLRYVVAGRTHPGVVRHEGEQYRESLVALVHELGLDQHVVFVDRFLNVDEIAQLLAITDVFCTPYQGENQIVSGALTFALAAGCPVVSTPYRYARDMLAGGAGLVVEFDDVDAFSDAIEQLLRVGPARQAALDAAEYSSRSLSWPAIGESLSRVLSDAMTVPSLAQHVIGRGGIGHQGSFDLDRCPSMAHLNTLCDDTAVLQHAHLKTPRHEDGYCVDDAARLLPIVSRLSGEPGFEHTLPIVARMLSFLRGAALGGNGDMRNFMSFDRRWLDDPHAGDHVGRAVWGLGELIRDGGSYSEESRELLYVLAPNVAASDSTRTLAYGALGLVAADAVHDDSLAAPLERVYQQLSEWKPENREWVWSEPYLAYDNARIPEALIRVGLHVGDTGMVDVGQSMLEWFEALCNVGQYHRFPGHLGLRSGGDIRWTGDEQPLEAVAHADAFAALALVRGSTPAIATVIDQAWSWFLGNNRLGIPVGDLRSGTCCDGLRSRDVNRNCGAESTISFRRCAETRQAHVALVATTGSPVVSNLVPQ